MKTKTTYEIFCEFRELQRKLVEDKITDKKFFNELSTNYVQVNAELIKLLKIMRLDNELIREHLQHKKSEFTNLCQGNGIRLQLLINELTPYDELSQSSGLCATKEGNGLSQRPSADTKFKGKKQVNVGVAPNKRITSTPLDNIQSHKRLTPKERKKNNIQGKLIKTNRY